jgi:hypothetical protein
MGLRERVQQAIAGPVGESERLNDLPTADAQTKLSILVSGWGARTVGCARGACDRDRRPAGTTNHRNASGDPTKQASRRDVVGTD